MRRPRRLPVAWPSRWPATWAEKGGHAEASLSTDTEDSQPRFRRSRLDLVLVTSRKDEIDMASLRARRVLLAGAAVLALVLVACGGSTKAASAPKTTTTTNRAGRLAAFRTCMAQQGVDLPADFTLGGFGGRRGAGATDTSGATDTTTGSIPTTTLPPGVTAQQYRTALQACASTLGTPGGGGAANNPQFTQYRDCINQYLTSHGGTTLPSTGAGGFGGGFGGFGGGAGSGATTTSNPLMQAALNQCASLRPAFTGRGGTTSTTK